MIANKLVYIKIYSAAGAFQGLITNFSITSFLLTINGGPSELTFTIPKQFDNYGEGGLINFNNEVKIYIYDKEAPNGVQVYEGYIAEYVPSVADVESVDVRCFGYGGRLSSDILKNTKTVEVDYNSIDPSQMIKNVITSFRANNPSLSVNYSGTSIATTGQTTTIQFNTVDYLTAINRIKQAAPYNWYWYLDVDNNIYFQQIPTTPTHYFVFEKDISSLKSVKSIVNMENGLIFWNGLQSSDPQYISNGYFNASSVASYGNYTSSKRDGRFTDATSAGQFGNSYVNAYGNPINTVTVEILDSNYYKGYDIETIKPGNTCKVLNIASTNGLSGNMLITSVEYKIGSVVLSLTDVRDYLDRSLNQMDLTIQDLLYTNSGPTTYT